MIYTSAVTTDSMMAVCGYNTRVHYFIQHLEAREVLMGLLQVWCLNLTTGPGVYIVVSCTTGQYLNIQPQCNIE